MTTGLQYEFFIPRIPLEVFEMLTNPKYLSEKIALADSGDFYISGNHPEFEITVNRMMTRKFPPMVTKFIGNNLVVLENQKWKENASKEFEAKFELTIPNAPVKVEGKIQLLGTDGNTQTKVSIIGQVKVNIPIFGAAAEPQVLNEIIKVISDEAQLCQKWSS